MSISSLNPALREKNDSDFVEVTRRLQIALEKIEKDPKLKATQEVLSRLAECSRGTINNRKWPLEQLQRIKDARKTPKAAENAAGHAGEREESRIERYKQQLFDSREEVLAWKVRHDEIVSRLSEQQVLTKALQLRNEALTNEIALLKKKVNSSKVIDLALSSPKKK